MTATSLYRVALMLCGGLLGASLCSIYLTSTQRPLTTTFARPQLPLPEPPAPTLVKAVDLKDTGINFALDKNGGVVTGGKFPKELNNGVMTNYDGNNGYGSTLLGFEPAESFLITFKDTPQVNCVRFLLWDIEKRRFYRYKLESSAEATGDKWQMLTDCTGPEHECRGWQQIFFDPRPIKRLKLTGTYNLENRRFHVVELEAYLNPPPMAASSSGDANNF